MPAHHQSRRSSGERAAASPRHRPCRKASLILQPVRFVDLDQAQEEAAITALADLLAPYLEPEEDAA
jgi:hypothetical protein